MKLPLFIVAAPVLVLQAAEPSKPAPPTKPAATPSPPNLTLPPSLPKLPVPEKKLETAQTEYAPGVYTAVPFTGIVVIPPVNDAKFVYPPMDELSQGRVILPPPTLLIPKKR